LALAQEKGQTHEGKIVKITKDELVMTGTDGKEHTHKLTVATKLRLDNKDITFTDISELKKDMKVRVTTKKGDPDTVEKVEVLSKPTAKFEEAREK
jgi:hypothetical protein